MQVPSKYLDQVSKVGKVGTVGTVGTDTKRIPMITFSMWSDKVVSIVHLSLSFHLNQPINRMTIIMNSYHCEIEEGRQTETETGAH